MTITLTARQERFCLLIVKCEAKATAYEQAGYSVKSAKVASVNAGKLLKNPAIQARIQELHQHVANRTVISLDSLTQDLLSLRDKAVAAGSFGPAVQAVGMVAKLHGFMVDKSEVLVHHRPAPLPTNVLELTEAEWVRQFGVEGRERNLKLIRGK